MIIDLIMIIYWIKCILKPKRCNGKTHCVERMEEQYVEKGLNQHLGHWKNLLKATKLCRYKILILVGIQYK